MKLIHIDELQEGMILAEDIIGHYDILYAASGTILNETIINGLKKMKVDYVYVVQSNEMKDNVVIVDKELNKEYKIILDRFKNIYFNAKVGKKIMTEELNDSVDSLVNEVVKSNNILSRLRQIEVNDEYTYKHSINVSLISTMIGKWMNMTQEELNDLALAGLLHDVGKSQIPNEILNKPGKLTNEEFKIIKEHAKLGYNIVKNIPNLGENIHYGVLEHHERSDGKGYPLGLKGDEIHTFGKIIAVADVYDAMTSNRIYKDKVSPFKVAELIFNNSFGELDPIIANVFLKNIFKFYVGNIVKLNNGDVGEVVLVNKFSPTRPLVKTSKGFIDLSKNYEYEIIDIIS